MAAAVLPTTNPPGPPHFHLPSMNSKTHHHHHHHHHHPSSSRLQPQKSSDLSELSTSTTNTTSHSSTGAFGRLRSSLEQSLRTATRHKKPPQASIHDTATITARKDKGKAKETVPSDPQKKDKEKSGVLRRLESKVTFRRQGRETPSPLPPLPTASNNPPQEKKRVAGFMSFAPPSLRQGSISSPSLHLASQPIPSPRSRPAIPASSSSNSDAIATPVKDRPRRQSLQPPKREISGPAPLAARRDPNQTPISRHRPSKSVPLPSLPPTPSSPNFPTSDSSGSSQSPDTPTPMNRDLPSPPSTPTPPSGSGNHLVRRSSSRKASPNHPPASPIAPRTSSPIRTRPRTNTPLAMSSSASSSHLPITPSSPSPTPRRLSIDSPRRTSFDTSRKVSGPPRRNSEDPPRRASIDTPRSPSFKTGGGGGGGGGEEDYPAPRPRPTSPNQRAYMQNRHFNISSASLSAGPTNPEHRELIRTASSMLCKEVVKIPPHMTRTESGQKDWEEMELRTRKLARAERIWGKSGVIINGSSTNLNSSSGGAGISVSAEERERRLFGDALRDGFVLCQLMNKLRSASIVKPDPKDDGILRTHNITKFLAACSSYGLAEDDLFQQDDLIQANAESLARVARTVIALIKFVDTPIIDKSKYLIGQGKKPAPIIIPGPYQHERPSSSSRGASSSTPNLLKVSSSPTSPSPPPHAKRRFSPPSGLPPVRSFSPDLAVKGTTSSKQPHGGGDESRHESRVKTPEPNEERAFRMMTPPPRSPLRARSKNTGISELATFVKSSVSPIRSSVADSTRASIGDASFAELSVHNARQSVASSAMTETTVTTDVSSILDMKRSGGNNKFGTIRTVTTDLTSEAPSMTRTEASAIADELARHSNNKSADSNGGNKHHRDRKLSEAHAVDLSRVVEEGDESASSSSRSKKEFNATTSTPALLKVVTKPEKALAVHLRKGKWPEDFMEAFPTDRPISPLSPNAIVDQEASFKSSTPISISPPRKLAIVGATRRNESLEAIPQFPRRPTHRARQSVDAPILMPKESVFGHRDSSPDSPVSSSPSPGPRMLRRHSTKPSMPQRNAVYLAPRSDGSRDRDSDSGDSRGVPFPRRTSGGVGASDEHSGTPSPSPVSGNGGSQGGPSSPEEKPPRILRGRFQSDINDSTSAAARQRARPNSYDELGTKPLRARFESMVNLGVGSSNASASDLRSVRDSLDGSAVRRTVILREDGKPPTHFQLGNCIGRGQFGSVYRALNLNTGQMVAVKRIRLEGLKEEEVTTLMREVDLVKSLSHPSIVKYEGMARDADTLSIVLEYAENGSLGQTLKAFGKLNERLIAGYVVKILEGLHYLHGCDVVHCDLKAANILTTKNGNVKLSDFGVSLNLRAMEREIKDVAGTPNWMAPEVIELKGASTKSDIWSLGCTVIELLTGRPPYAEIANSMSVMFRIVEDNMPPLPESCSPFLEDFLQQCFNKDPQQRPSAELLCEHPWLKQNWGKFQELRPQDSIPFLRRVSADLQKSEFVRYLSQIEIPESPKAESSAGGDEKGKASPLGRRTSDVSMHALSDNDLSPREHSFAKATFSKPMICRVCLLNVKKGAVLCAQCSLIAHSKCAANAPPTCDLRSQLLLYANYAENGNPASVYFNPADGLREHATSPASDVPYVAHTPRTSLEGPAPSPHTPIPQQLNHPPTAYRFMAAFKRSRSRPSLSPEPTPSAASSSSQLATKHKEDKVLRKKPPTNANPEKDRPRSLTRTGADPHSVRTSGTQAESFSSRHERRSAISSNGTDQGTRKSAGGVSENWEAVRSSRISAEPETVADHDVSSNMGHIPGAMPSEPRKQKKRDKSPGCTLQ